MHKPSPIQGLHTSKGQDSFEDTFKIDNVQPCEDRSANLCKESMQKPVFETAWTREYLSDAWTKEANPVEKDKLNQILVVDSDNFNREAVHTLVNSFGFQCDLSGSGAEGLELVKQRLKLFGSLHNMYKLIIVHENSDVDPEDIQILEPAYLD